jgi:hypothetical protein
MRANATLPLLALILGLAPFSAGAGELFRKGPVICTAASPKVTALSVGECHWQKTEGGGFYSGSCDGRVAVGGQEIQFVVSGQAKRIDYVFPDNSTPLTFDYQGLTCFVQSPRLKTVRNCRSSGDGLSKHCQICAVTAAKVCFEVQLDVTVKSRKVAETTVVY